MTHSFFAFPFPFAEPDSGVEGAAIALTLLGDAGFSDWRAAQDVETQAQLSETGFTPGAGKCLALRAGGHVCGIVAGASVPLRLGDAAAIAEFAARTFSKEALEGKRFFLNAPQMSPAEVTNFAIGWALASYAFTLYKDPAKACPILFWPEKADRAEVRAQLSGIALLRNLINAPAADMGPAEMEGVARELAEECGAECSAIVGEDLLAQNFPMIYAVGKGSMRAPRLIEMRRRREGAPKIALVGKGISFDTGGLDIKPGNAMSLMKKDMGGAAHAFGLFRTLCALDLALDVRLLVPAAENAVSAEAFRPRDILRSRKGLTVEVLDTDAEGRLVLGDALAYACEEQPDFLIDFATLTGAARVALGFDVPALFAARAETGREIQSLALSLEDPLWQMPLWKPYARELEGEISDLVNIGSGPAGSITAALFLEKFVTAGADWVHLDLYAWEQSGKPGRPKGGAEMGFRTVLSYLRSRFCALSPAG